MQIIKTSYINFYKIEDILQFLEENKNITNAIEWRIVLKGDEIKKDLEKFSYLRLEVLKCSDETYTMLRNSLGNNGHISDSIDYIPKLNIIDRMLELIEKIENNAK